MHAINPTARDLRRVNRRTILQAIHAEGSISRLEISQRTGLSFGTVTNVIAELLAEGVVLEAGFEASGGGRRRTILTLNLEYGYLLGGEIGETDIIVELFDLNLKKIAVFHHSLKHEIGEPAPMIGHVAEGVKHLLADAGITQERVLGLGLGVPGLVEHTEESVVVAAPSWHWTPVPLTAMLREHFSFPLHVENGSKMMALAEMWSLASVENMVVINLGTGASVGIISEEKLYRGATNSAGEWGHMIVMLDGRRCRCGQQGCLEAYIGAPGIIARLKEIDPSGRFVPVGEEIETITRLIEVARQQNHVARSVLDETTRLLGTGIVNLVNLFNPRHIVLGGWLGVALGEYMLPALCQFIEGRALQHPFQATTITVSQLKRDAVSSGAALFVLENFIASKGNLNGQARVLTG